MNRASSANFILLLEEDSLLVRALPDLDILRVLGREARPADTNIHGRRAKRLKPDDRRFLLSRPRRLSMIRLCLSLLLLSLFVACAGSGGNDTATTEPTSSREPVSPPIDLDTAAMLSGKAILEGSVPQQEGISMAADPFCVRMHMNEVKTELVTVNEDGSLRNVFVYIKEGLEDRRFAPPAEPVVLAQKGCVYIPHVLGIMTGQTLEILNDDDTLHNVRAVPEHNPPFNLGQPRRGHKVSRTFDNPEIMIPIKCDVHKWMGSYVGVVEHPYYAVTGDAGAFELPKLPPGSYVLEAWHETLGPQRLDITLAEKETREVTFTFRAAQ